MCAKQSKKPASGRGADKGREAGNIQRIPLEQMRAFAEDVRADPLKLVEAYGIGKQAGAALWFYRTLIAPELRHEICGWAYGYKRFDAKLAEHARNLLRDALSPQGPSPDGSPDTPGTGR